MRRLSLILLAVLMTISLIGCTPKKEEVITMGFVPMRDGDKLIESVEPLTEMLSKELGVKVEGFTATNYVGVVEGLGSGQVDFGFIPPFAYVLANKESNAQVILTALNKDLEAKYRSQFIVRKDSGIKSFADIKGKKVAFVDPSSTSGYLFPGAHLIKEGIDLEKDIQYVYSGGHDKSLQLLLNGDVDVATTFVDVRDRYEKDFPDANEKTEILGYTEYIPNISVTIRGNMEKDMQDKIKNALLNIASTDEGKSLLKDLFNMYGFTEATDADYDIIRTTAETMDVDLKAAE
ncbi:phosphate/phosphite/phosphonate ABC transporter substrate-binding protein [Paratissierella segnis]|jgi:phosphonate transport system substrate-binding protein|uniref:Phosphate/phosphite/phosphonate ABC transporter substrate-binding protein n=1 Tax=Paratissierella segnis TaxID=2763679 RepID=A0A926EVN3_9FIRM|nr:phosphate/phosphite/phosphonate ABC transporter substrate-binding protein [Paratissierella segnis]MBC8587154.1 phosphate/phosphite/phosphonate ABC transporter substrate-binding protein [Paratissierella segnis]